MAPEKYKIAGILMMIAGIINILLALVWTCGFAGSLYLTICCWVPLIPAVIGGMEIWTGIRIQRGEVVSYARVLSILGAISGAMMCYGVIPLVAEIVASVFLGSDESIAWVNAQAAEKDPLLLKKDEG